MHRESQRIEMVGIDKVRRVEARLQLHSYYVGNWRALKGVEKSEMRGEEIILSVVDL